MNTYHITIRLTEAEQEKLLKIQQRLTQQLNTTISINQTVKHLINKEKENDK